MDDNPIIREVDFSSTTCHGCGKHAPDVIVKQFALALGNNSHTIVYCQECAAKIAQFLLHAWEE